MSARFLSWLRSVLSEGTPDSVARLMFFLVGITTCATFTVAMLYSLWTHGHGANPYDLPRNLSDSLRDIFIAAGAGKVVQRIFGENAPAVPSVSPGSPPPESP